MTYKMLKLSSGEIKLQDARALSPEGVEVVGTIETELRMTDVRLGIAKYFVDRYWAVQERIVSSVEQFLEVMEEGDKEAILEELKNE